MKLKVNWKELGKLLWAAVKPVLLAAIGGGIVSVATGCSSMTPTSKSQTLSVIGIGIPAIAVVSSSSQGATAFGGDLRSGHNFGLAFGEVSLARPLAALRVRASRSATRRLRRGRISLGAFPLAVTRYGYGSGGLGRSPIRRHARRGRNRRQRRPTTKRADLRPYQASASPFARMRDGQTRNDCVDLK